MLVTSPLVTPLLDADEFDDGKLDSSHVEVVGLEYVLDAVPLSSEVSDDGPG